MMNAHCRLSCGNETHFFEGLTGAVVEYITDRHHWPGRACDYVRRLKHVGRTIFELYQVDHAGYANALTLERPSISAILSCFMGTHLAQTGKLRWVEKTPTHLKRFALIREHFAHPRVICIFRDPRDVALSIVKAPWGPSTFADGLLVWKSYLEHYRRFIAGDPNVLTIMFEHLVQDPSGVSKRICSFIGEDFDARMVDTSLSAAGVGSSLEPYKQNAAKPVDVARAFAWRNEADEHDLALADWALGADLLSLGYPLSGASRPTAAGGSAARGSTVLARFLGVK